MISLYVRVIKAIFLKNILSIFFLHYNDIAIDLSNNSIEYIAADRLNLACDSR